MKARVTTFTATARRFALDDECKPLGTQPICSFADQCEFVRSQSNSLKLYESKDGRFIPNFRYLHFVKKADLCADVGFALLTQLDSIRSDVADERKLREAEFLQSMTDRGDGNNYLLVTQEILKDAYNRKIDPEKFASRSEAEDYLRGFEIKAKVSLSDEARRIWAQRLVSEWPSLNRLANDPFLYPELLTTVYKDNNQSQILSHQKTYLEKLKEAEAIVEETRKELVSTLESYRTQENSNEIDNLIQRIKTVHHDTSFKKCDSPNATYDPSRHSFSLCPQVLNLPKMNLKMIVAHEFSHAIDPCVASFPLKKVTGQKAPVIPTKTERGRVEFKIESERQQVHSSIDEEFVRQQYNGELVEIKFEEVLPGIDFDSHPFAKNKNLECLQKEKSFAARIPTMEKSRNSLNRHIQEKIESGTKENDPELISLKKTLRNLDSQWKMRRACQFIPGEISQIQEAFSDHLSSKVVAASLEKVTDPKGKKDAAFELSGFFVGTSCAMNASSFESGLKNEVPAPCLSDQSTGAFFQDLSNIENANAAATQSHPGSAVRMNRGFFSHPSIRRALQCQEATPYETCP